MTNKKGIIFSIVTAFVFFAFSAHAGEDSLTGTWRTEAPVTYLVEFTTEHPHGKLVPHEGVQILERSASLEWVLTQRPDGYIIGTNHWTAYDEKGKKVLEASEPLLGTYDGQRWMLIEPPDEKAKTAQIVFEVTREGPDKVRGIGYSVNGPKLLAMHFTLVRKP